MILTTLLIVGPSGLMLLAVAGTYAVFTKKTMDLPIVQSLATLVWDIAGSCRAGHRHFCRPTWHHWDVYRRYAGTSHPHALDVPRHHEAHDAGCVSHRTASIREYFPGHRDHAMANLAEQGRAWWDPRLWAEDVARQVEQYDFPQYNRAPSPCSFLFPRRDDRRFDLHHVRWSYKGEC